ncbi:MAG: DUF2088 domain-containing protein [Anaerolineae bacterium]|nr:DUF2088 domain-containing protein [Anaerolineae bacterium]
MEGTAGRIIPRRSLEGLRLVKVRQRWDQPDVRDVAGEARRQLEATGALERIQLGDEIAITAGSRGIASMPTVLRVVVEAVRACGGQPFIFPAMGSHGGGTAEGQCALLASLGIDEASMGAPIRATMDVIQIGQIEAGLPVYLDAIAAQADGIIAVNRIKKHTNYDGPIESGLCKMAVIGMGKHRQAVSVHQYGNPGLRDHIPPIARVVFSQAKVLAGLGILENAWGGVAELVGLRPGEIVDREPELLKRAKSLSAKLPFQEIDIALVERIGKDISGTGMDCYVVGRRRIIGEPEWDEAPTIRSLVLLDLTEASHGNGVGVGLSDFTTRRLAEKIDWTVTQANIMTSGNLERGKLPFVLDTDREALEMAAFRERTVPVGALRLVAMRDTLHLRELLVSEPLAREAAERGDLEILSAPAPLPLDERGNWISPF